MEKRLRRNVTEPSSATPSCTPRGSGRHPALGALAIAGLLVAACNDEVSGELRLSTSVPTATATAHATLWEYDPQVADASATPIAQFASAALAQGEQVIPFVLRPDNADGDRSHYVTALVDLDSDGLDEPGDFVVNDFYKVELGSDGVIITLVPRTLR